MAPEKHSPAVDDELKNPRHNAPVGTRHDGRAEDSDTAPEDDTYIGVRAEIARFIEPSAFPADKTALLAAATDHDASDDVMRLLQDLPEGDTFATTQEVVDALPLNPSQPDG